MNLVSRQFGVPRIPVALTALLLLLAAMTPWSASAGSVDTGVIAMFPKQVAEFAYLDLKSARQDRWFQAFRDQLLPPNFASVERGLISAGIDPNTQVDQIVWGLLPVSKRGNEELVGIAFGSFDPSSGEDRLKQQKATVVDYQDVQLYATGAAGSSGVLLTFLDSNTVAFGQRRALEQLIDLRMGRGESLLTNDALFPLISGANASSVGWAVFDKSDARREIRQLIPEASLFPQAATIILRIQAMMINVDAGASVDVQLQAVCSSVDDANLLGALVQAGVMLRRYQGNQSNSDPLQDMLENVQVIPRGDRLQVQGSVNDDQLDSIIRSRDVAPSR